MLVKVESKLTYVDADGKPMTPQMPLPPAFGKDAAMELPPAFNEDASQERPCAPVREKLGLPAGVMPRAPAKPPHRVLGRNRKHRPDGCSAGK